MKGLRLTAFRFPLHKKISQNKLAFFFLETAFKEQLCSLKFAKLSSYIIDSIIECEGHFFQLLYPGTGPEHMKIKFTQEQPQLADNSVKNTRPWHTCLN